MTPFELVGIADSCTLNQNFIDLVSSLSVDEEMIKLKTEELQLFYSNSSIMTFDVKKIDAIEFAAQQTITAYVLEVIKLRLYRQMSI